MTDLESFINGPLVTWIGTFKADKVRYEDLIEGIFLNKVMEQIDPGLKVKDVDYFSLNCSSRIANFERLLRSIATFYQTSSQQMVVMKLPDIVKIAKEGESESVVDELNKILLLMLGCAVQSEQKETFVEKIKTLDIQVQEQLVDAIKLVTDNDGCSLFPDDINDEDMSDTAQVMYKNIRQLVNERDLYYHSMCDLYQDVDYYRGLVEKRDSVTMTPENGRIENYQRSNSVEQLRVKIRDLQEENDDKTRQVSELSRDLEDRDLKMTKMKLENCRLNEERERWTQEQSEMEILREKAETADRLESEVFHLKQKVAELDFYKNRVEEFRVENGLLLDRRTELETRLDKASKRSESLIDEIVHYQLQEDESKVERDQLRTRVQALVEEQAAMEKDRNKLLTQLRLERERAECEAAQAIEGPSLSEELMNTTFTEQVFELQVENEHLRDQLERIREELEHDARWRCMDLQRKIAYLQAELTKAKEKSKQDDEKLKQSDVKLKESSRKYDRLEDELSMLKDRHDAEVETYQAQLNELRRQIIHLRKRNCQENDVRYHEIEEENVTMFNDIQSLSTQVTRLKYDNRVLRKSCDKLKEDVDKSAPFSDENERLRTENYDLRRTAASAKVAMDVTTDLESRNLRLEIETRKLKKLVNALKATLSRVDPLNRISYHYVTSL